MSGLWHVVFDLSMDLSVAFCWGLDEYFSRIHRDVEANRKALVQRVDFCLEVERSSQKTLD